MDTLTELIRREISLQYKSTRQFALYVGIPLSTITSALKKGVGGMSYDSVVKICEALGIQKLTTFSPGYASADMRALMEAYGELDKAGRHTVNTVAQVELMRCEGITGPARMAAFSGGPATTQDGDAGAASAEAVRNLKKKTKGNT